MEDAGPPVQDETAPERQGVSSITDETPDETAEEEAYSKLATECKAEALAITVELLTHVKTAASRMAKLLSVPPPKSTSHASKNLLENDLKLGATISQWQQVGRHCVELLDSNTYLHSCLYVTRTRPFCAFSRLGNAVLVCYYPKILCDAHSPHLGVWFMPGLRAV